MIISQRAQRLAPSVTLAAAAKAKALKAQGKDVLNLTVGEPDFVTPKTIQQAAIAAIENGKASYYTPASGLPALKEAILQYTQDCYGLTYATENVIVTDGAKYGLYLIFQALLNAGDEVLIPIPYWVSYGEQVKLAEGVPIFVPTTEENQLKVTVEQLEAHRTAQTKVVIINSPSNPTGMIYTKEELEAIGNWAVAHRIYIVSDDIYGQLVYRGHTFTPMATVSKAIQAQTIVVNGVSKTYAMTGWRIGYVLAEAKLIEAMNAIASQSTSNAATVSQYAAIAAYRGDQKEAQAMRAIFEERLEAIYPKVQALPGVRLLKPQGAFYLFINMQEALQMCGYPDATALVNDLLDEAQVALVTGAGFGAPNYVRFSYAADLATLDQAVARIAQFIQKKSQK